jgi:hypothetical protein
MDTVVDVANKILSECDIPTHVVTKTISYAKCVEILNEVMTKCLMRLKFLKSVADTRVRNMVSSMNLLNKNGDTRYNELLSMKSHMQWILKEIGNVTSTRGTCVIEKVGNNYIINYRD